MADTAKNYISQIKLGGTTYDIKDVEARNLVANGVHYVGISNTAELEDGYTGNVSVNNAELNAKVGDIVLKAFTDKNNATIHREFIWNGEHWDEFGSSGAIGAMAFANTASGITDVHNHELSTTENTTIQLASEATVSVEGTYKMPSGTGSAKFSTDKFVQSYPGVTGKLVTTKITGVGETVTINQKPTFETGTLETKTLVTVKQAAITLHDTPTLNKTDIVPSYTEVKGQLDTTDI